LFSHIHRIFTFQTLLIVQIGAIKLWALVDHTFLLPTSPDFPPSVMDPLGESPVLDSMLKCQFPCKKGDQILNSSVVVASIELVQVKCGVRGDVGPACNVVGYLDRNLLGINHLYQHPVYQRTPVCYLCLPNSLFSINFSASCSRS
jgi:hypothetical protein